MSYEASEQDIERKETQESVYGQEMSQDQSAQLIRWQEDLDPVLLELFHNLRSEFFDGKEYRAIQVQQTQPDGTVVMVNLKPKLNEEDAYNLIMILKPIINKNTMLGTHEKKSIAKIIIKMSDDISFFISQMIGNLKIDIATAHMIDSTVSQLVHNTYNRGLNNQERNYAGKTQKTVSMVKQEYITDKMKKQGQVMM